MDWCLWATTTSTNNRKSVVAINLHACLLLLEGQGLWGSMSSFSKAGRLPKCNSQPKTVAFWKVGHQLPSVQSSSVPVPFARTNDPRDAPVVSRGGDGSYQMDGNSSSADAGWKGPVQDKQVRQPMNGWLAGGLLCEFSDSRRCGRASAALHRVPSSICRQVVDSSAKDPRQGCAVGRVVSLFAGARGRGCDASFGSLFQFPTTGC